MPPELYKQVVIASIKEEKKDVKTFTLAAADGKPIPYTAGQFITLLFNHHHKEERRSFSICSSPELGEPLAVTVKRVDNGAYSRWLTDRATEGATLLTTGASGLFIIPGNIAVYKQVFFFAAGIGITPIFSIIKTLLHTVADTHIVLIYSNRSKEDAVFYDELSGLAAQHSDRFRIEFLYSTAFDLSRARLSKLLLPTLLEEYRTAEKKDMLFYLCGPSDYMRMVIITLEEQGIDTAQIKRENFNTNGTPVRKIEPPDKTTHTAHIHLGSDTYDVVVQYPDSILQAAKKQGVHLPYSCETGRCGSCAALCVQGKIWLSYNEVLMDADLAAGKTLTCVGHPVNGDVTLQI
jgi:ring-1,2-phenylacetyl-CoA epoxidase subunit PaaE